MDEPAVDPALALRTSQLIVGALVVGPLVLAVIAGVVDLGSGVRILTLPAALFGVVSPVIGYRLYHSVRDGLAPDASQGERCRAFTRANLVALAVTEAAAFLGIVAYMLSGEPWGLLGLLMHVLLAAAIWPSAERFEGFTDSTR